MNSEDPQVYIDGVPAGGGEELQGIEKVSSRLQMSLPYPDVKKRLPQVAHAVEKGVAVSTIAADESLFFLTKIS